MQHVTPDGVTLFYEERGEGDPPLLFVHGWTCDHTYFAPQARYFENRHRVVSIDQRGHGASDKPEQEYTMPGFADDVLSLSHGIGLERPVLVGHSMGGVIALEAVARHPDQFRAAVMVDAPILLPEGFRELLTDFIEQLRSPDYQAAQGFFVENMLFTPYDDAQTKGRVLAEMGSCPQHVMASALDQATLQWDGAAAAAAAKVPLLYIGAHDVVADIALFKSLAPQLVVGQTVGAGHFNQLLAPEQVNSMIERFLAISL